jgi:hypothetical protein
MAGRAALARHRQDDGEAERCFRAALELHDRVDLPLERVETLIDFAAFVRCRGGEAEAGALVADAIQLAERCGSVWLAARASASLIEPYTDNSCDVER